MNSSWTFLHHLNLKSKKLVGAHLNPRLPLLDIPTHIINLRRPRLMCCSNKFLQKPSVSSRTSSTNSWSIVQIHWRYSYRPHFSLKKTNIFFLSSFGQILVMIRLVCQHNQLMQARRVHCLQGFLRSISFSHNYFICLFWNLDPFKDISTAATCKHGPSLRQYLMQI